VRSAALLLAAIVVAGCGGEQEQKANTGGVRQLDNVLELRSDFEADRGKTRLLVLLSPT
jgi:hypothetical protein